MAVRKKKRVVKKRRKAKPLSPTVRRTLAAKARKSRISLSKLTKVYRRGQGAYLSSGSRPGVSMSAWAHAKVNSFIRGSRKHDLDLRRKKRAKTTRKKK